MVRNSHVNQLKLEKKKDLDLLFYIKGFGWLRFNSLKLIWIQSDSSQYEIKQRVLTDLKFKSNLEY
jgi:hypothetical protein